MTRRTVSQWPSYLLKNVPEPERRWLSSAAAAQNISVTDIIRRLLCDRYNLDCPPESYRYNAERDAGATTVLLRLQPKLVTRLEREAARTGRSKRSIILAVIAAEYEKEGTPA